MNLSCSERAPFVEDAPVVAPAPAPEDAMMTSVPDSGNLRRAAQNRGSVDEYIELGIPAKEADCKIEEKVGSGERGMGRTEEQLLKTNELFYVS